MPGTRWNAVVPLVAVLAGCVGGSDVDGSGHEFTLKGALLVPTPVEGALVDVFRLDGDSGQVRIGGGMTGTQGDFSVDLVGIRQGDVLLVRASGAEAVWQDPAWERECHLGEGYYLEAAFLYDEATQDDVLVLEPFSTLVVELARTYGRNPQKHGLSRGDWATVLPVAVDRMGHHLLSGAPPEVGRTVPELPDAEHAGNVGGKAALALAQVGLARLVHNLCAGNDVGFQELNAALLADIADGVLDGSGVLAGGKSAGQLFVCGQALSADTFRYFLAESVHSWVAYKEAHALAAELGSRSGMYDSLALDGGPLFGGLPGKLFDPLHPVFVLDAESPPEGSLLCAQADLILEVHEDHELSKLERIAPDPGSFPDVVEVDGAEGTARVTIAVNPDDAQGPTYPKVQFTYRATDSAGNETEITVTYNFDRDAPALPQVAPDPSGCLAGVPAAFVVAAVDEPSGIDSLEIATDGSKTACTPLEDGKWSCPAGSLEDGSSVQVTARDFCGNESVLDATACLDSMPPVVTFDPPDGAWYSPENAAGEVTVTDDKGVASVAVDGPLGPLGCDMACTVQVPLPTGEDVTHVTVEVVAVDVAGRETAASAKWQLDGELPALAVTGSQKVLKPAAVLSVMVTASDGQSGIAKVAVQGGSAEWTVQALSGDGYLATGKFPQLPPAGFLPLVLMAQDKAGNGASLNFALWLDDTAPEIPMGEWTFQDESGATAQYNSATGEVTYDLSMTTPVSFSPATCAEICPEFSRFASRVPLVKGLELSEQNAPAFLLGTVEPCPPQGFESQTTFISAFFHGETLLKEYVFPPQKCGPMQLYVPIALEMFSDVPAAEFSFADELLPDRLVVTAVDLAGNASSREILFAMRVLPPPLFLEAVPADQWPADTLAAAAAPGTTLLHTLADAPKLLTRQRLVNPTPVAAVATLAEHPQEKVEMLSSRIYLPQDGACTGACPTGQCKVQAPPPANPSCGPAPEFDPAAWWGGTMFAAVHASIPEPGAPGPLAEGYELPLPAGSEFGLDVRTRYGDEGLALPEPSLIFAPGGGQADAYVLSDKSWLASCTWNAGLPPKPTCYTMPELLVAFTSTPAQATLGLSVRTPAGTEESLQMLPVTWKPAIWVPPFTLEFAPF